MPIKFNEPCFTGHGSSYQQTPQSNPLRWTILYKEADGSYTPTSHPFRCKDFLNDAVAKYLGRDVNVYHFAWAGTKINEEGVYLQLTNLANYTIFKKNIGSIKLFPGYGDEIVLEKIDSASCVCFVPRSYFNSTYTISFLAYLIRVSNVDVEIDPNEEGPVSWKTHPTKSVDNPFGSYFIKILDGSLLPPVDVALYLGKSPEKQDMSKADKYEIHINGCASWQGAIHYDFA